MRFCARTTFRIRGQSYFSRRMDAATPALIADVRGEFASWMARTLTTTDGRRADIILAVYEAMANATEHAYPRGDQGEVSIRAHYVSGNRTLRVLIRDRGAWWHKSSPTPGRGYGIGMIRALCDRVVITSPMAGTTVDLNWALAADAHTS